MAREIKDTATLVKQEQQAGDALPPFLQKKIAGKKGGKKSKGGGKKGRVPPAFLKQQGK